jgi:hypothetical protein
LLHLPASACCTCLQVLAALAEPNSARVHVFDSG